MHKIEYEIRHILSIDLPSEDPQTLANMGIVSIGSDYYSCCVQHERDDQTLEWRAERELPGTKLSSGGHKERFDKLPYDVRQKVMKARIERAKDKTKKARDVAADEREVVHVNVSDVGRDSDIVLEENIIPHTWAGERP